MSWLCLVLIINVVFSSVSYVFSLLFFRVSLSSRSILSRLYGGFVWPLSIFIKLIGGGFWGFIFNVRLVRLVISNGVVGLIASLIKILDVFEGVLCHLMWFWQLFIVMIDGFRVMILQFRVICSALAFIIWGRWVISRIVQVSHRFFGVVSWALRLVPWGFSFSVRMTFSGRLSVLPCLIV